jgi:hypothetical protein
MSDFTKEELMWLEMGLRLEMAGWQRPSRTLVKLKEKLEEMIKNYPENEV